MCIMPLLLLVILTDLFLISQYAIININLISCLREGYLYPLRYESTGHTVPDLWWLTDRLTNRLTDRLTNRLADRLTNRLTDRLTDRQTD